MHVCQKHIEAKDIPTGQIWRNVTEEEERRKRKEKKEEEEGEEEK